LTHEAPELTLDQKILFIKDSNGSNGLSVHKLAEKYLVSKSSAANIFMLTIVFFKLCSKVVFNELWEELSWIRTSLRNELEKGSEIHFNSYRNDFGEKKSKTSLKWTPPYSGHFEKVPWVSTIERLYCSCKTKELCFMNFCSFSNLYVSADSKFDDVFACKDVDMFVTDFMNK
jgi:hypothetical protein